MGRIKLHHILRHLIFSLIFITIPFPFSHTDNIFLSSSCWWNNMINFNIRKIINFMYPF